MKSVITEDLIKYSESPNEILQKLLKESKIELAVYHFNAPYKKPQIVLDTYAHDLEVREEAYNKGYADGSLSVTEQIIKKKVIKVLKEKRARLDNNPYFGTASKVKLIDELIEEFSK